MGLITAAERFDPTRGVQFKTFVEQRIRGTIMDELRAQDWLTRSLREETGIKNLCLAGGVALNCVANGRILRERELTRGWLKASHREKDERRACARTPLLATLFR